MADWTTKFWTLQGLAYKDKADLWALADRRLIQASCDASRDDVILSSLKLLLNQARTFATSLPLSGTDHNVHGGVQNVNLARSRDGDLLDMSYENLLLLENVKCTACPATVKSFTGHKFDKCNQIPCDIVHELCTICQEDYSVGDLLMLLPCLHSFHDVCGSEWLLKHSKLCPICKLDVTVKA